MKFKCYVIINKKKIMKYIIHNKNKHKIKNFKTHDLLLTHV